WYEDSVFHVNGFGFPPIEPSSATRAYYGNINFFGGPSTTSVKASSRLKQLEEENEDAMFVIVSDVWLDSVEVKMNMQLCNLQFVFLESLKTLADVICAYPSIHSRIQYCSQEIIIMREDLVNKMCRNCVRLPNNNLDIPNHGHLTPLPLYVSPVFWAYDYSLRVYPVPDVIVFADKYDPFTISSTDCLCVNPGSFPRSGFTFKVYYPSNRTVEDRMKHVAGGNLHTSMSGSCGTCLDGVLYLFGGHHARGNTNRIYRLPLRAPSLVWEEMRDLKGLPPSSKDKLGCWVYKNRLIFFGGYGYAPQGCHRGTFQYDESSSLMWDSPGRGWNNHIHVLDLETSTWSQPITQVETVSQQLHLM
ncbi:hypothetical protein GOODEAATRI_004518, partial [Goodea atripinnis]